MTIDFDSFTTEPVRAERPKRRAAAVLGAAMLVAAAGGVGFGLGRSGGSGDVIVAPAEQPATPVANTGAPVENPASSADDITSDTIMIEERSDVLVDVPTAYSTASGGDGYTQFTGQPMELIAERVTDTGITLRAHLGPLWDQTAYYGEDFGGPSGWTPPGWCFESGQVRIALGVGTTTGPDVIDVGSVSWWTEPFQGRAISWLTLGSADGNPHRVVFVQTTSEVTSVTVTHGDGATDSVAPVDGVAMLVVPGAPETIQHDDGGSIWYEETPDFDITFDGPESVTITDAQQARGWDDVEYRESCEPPPPALPQPGEQPADPAAAEQMIIDTMATIYSDSDSETNGELIDDPTGVAEAREQVREGGFEEAAASAEAIVEELVFTTPTEAWFRYRIETSTGTFDRRFGIAVDVGGVWKITRNTICQDLQMAGGDCGGGVEVISPPWIDDGGE
jgi:hypothetical protein